ncbi:MAG: DUF4129 domain-containing protein [Acidimicrobiia bacterium]|nr:DUF4129 domain-containing protein [Acidimicrobiia bacterium]
MSGLVRSARWLVIPAAVFLLVMIGLALSAAPRPESGEQELPNEQADPASDNLPPPPEPSAQESVTEPPSVTIAGEDGTVEIRFDPDGVARASVEGQEGEFDLVPGTSSGVRVTPDGTLEPVPPGMIGPDDLGLTPTDQGVDVHAPDNPLVELRPDGRTGGVSATEFDGNTVTPLTGPDSTVVLDDGTTITPIELPGDGVAIVVATPREMPWRWIATTIAALAVASALTGYLLHRKHVEPTLAVTTTLDWATDGSEDFEGFLERLAADPDPTRAIRLAFHAVEQGLSGLPVRRDEETPFEWHRRASDTVPAVEATLGRICDLYAKARFAPGRATEQDRRDMIADLRRLVGGTHTPQPPRSNAGTTST